MMETLLSVLAFVIAIAAHEAAHAWSAEKLGDNTARLSGRMTLNPAAHIDIVGTILLPFLLLIARFPVIFGWAKPVPVDPSNFASPRKGMMITSAAGPVTNFLLAALFSLFFNVTSGEALLFPAVRVFFVHSVLINLVVGVFNLIPIPPLDGSNILAGILPEKAALSYLSVSRYGFLILIALLYFGLFERVVLPVVFLFIQFLLKQ